jgi:hypothetical protein
MEGHMKITNLNNMISDENILIRIRRAARNELPVLSMQSKCYDGDCAACADGCVTGCSSGCPSCPNGCPRGVSYL